MDTGHSVAARLNGFSHFVDAKHLLKSGAKGEAAKDERPPGGVESLAVHGVSPDINGSYASAKWGISVALDHTGFVTTYKR